MSTLTKILIVLLTISSIFLCGIVVTYVGSATNYKDQVDSLRTNNRSLTSNNENLINQVNELNEQIKQTAISNSDQMAALQQEINQVTTERDKYKIDLGVAQKRIEDNAAIVNDNLLTVATNNQMLKDAQAKVIELETLKTNNSKQINELNTAILAKDTILTQNEAEIKRLTEVNTQLQNQLDQYLLRTGRTTSTPGTFTRTPGTAEVTPPAQNLNLAGVISEVKPNDSLASINKGSANGVKQGMVFHVIRNDKFICDIVIFSTDADQASGYFDLVGEDIPRAGDIVKTNF